MGEIREEMAIIKQNRAQGIVNIKRLSLAIFLVLIFAVSGFCFWIQGQYSVPILMYHSVSSENTSRINVLFAPLNFKFPLIVISPEKFADQMDFLKSRGYHVIPLEDYVEGNRARKKFPHKTVVITFDDGYLDNYTNAFPVLKKYHFPATIFLITQGVGKYQNMLTWDQVKEMSRYGISFGSHTRSHVYLPSLSEERLKDEIIGSKRDIEEHLGKPVYFLAYPIGGFNDQAKFIIELAGYKAAFTTNRGYDRWDVDLYELNRIRVNNRDNKISLKAKLSGYYNFFRESKAPY